MVAPWRMPDAGSGYSACGKPLSRERALGGLCSKRLIDMLTATDVPSFSVAGPGPPRPFPFDKT